MQTLEESLKQFGQAAADAMDELMGLMPASVSITQDAATARRTLQRYTDLVQQIGQVASASGLAGVQSMCALVETNLLLLHGEGRPLSPDEYAALEEWPNLLFGYLANQADSESSMLLLLNLSGAWPMPLPENEAEEELQRLTRQPLSPAFQPAAMAEQTSFAGEVPTAGTIQSASLASGSQQAALPPAEVQQVDREMLAILAKELGQMQEQIADDLAAISAPHGSPDKARAALSNYVELLERLAMTVESIGLTALGSVFTRIAQQLLPQTEGLLSGQQALLQQLPERVAAYLNTPDDKGACAALVDILASTAWQTPVAEDVAPVWIQALTNVELTENVAQVATRPTHADLEDVSLELPGDVNPELIDGLLQELPVQTSAFTAAIAHIAAGSGNAKDMERAMRAAHTLKGAANTVGVRGIANLTHHLEDILVALIDADRMPGHSVANVLMNAGDCLEAMSETLMGMGAAPAQAQEVLQEVLDCANRIDREGFAVESEQGERAALPSVTLVETQAAEQAAMPLPAHEQSLRVPAPVVDELLRLAGETLIASSQIKEHLRLTINQSAVIRQQNQLIHQLVAELEELVDIRGVTSPQQEATTDSEFDALEFQSYSELHTVTHRLLEAATDTQEMAADSDRQLAALEELLEEQHKLQMANQYTVMRTRMVPVSSVVSRLQRSVRQTGRLLDKQVQLEIKGENTNIDSHVLNDLMDPLMHVLRNAVDHGIEAPEVRAAVGKLSQGRIELSFAREGNSIVVRCRDDGAGLDYAAVRRIAERKGMISAGQELSEAELARLILTPGFSTREETSQVSGRGVGMDVVFSRVQEMKGTLVLNSRRGEGMMIELRLPATLLSTHTLIVRQREKRLAVSSRGVEDIRYITREQIQQIGPRQFFRDGETVHSLIKLETLLSLPGDRRAHDRHGFPVLLTRMDTGEISAVLVQEILDSREVVMKNFGRYVPRTQGVIGAVILGDGGVAPVIDLVELLHAPMRRELQGQQAEQIPVAGKLPDRKTLTALVVDDSLSARRAVVQVMKDAGFDTRAASDGLEAVSMLARYVPDIILTDMEMPRMNGLELASHVRSSDRTKHVPVIMITSRSTEKHRQMGESSGVSAYITKPFSDDELLQQAVRLTKR